MSQHRGICSYLLSKLFWRWGLLSHFSVKGTEAQRGGVSCPGVQGTRTWILWPPSTHPPPSTALFTAVIWVFRPAEEAGAGGGSCILEGSS